MKKIICAIALVVISVFMAITPLLLRTPAIAASEGCVDTNFFGEQCGSEGINNTLKMVVRIFTVAVGVLAAIGITITGTQYLTAGGNEEQTRKAKRRLFEIVLGVVAFVLIYSILSWLLPGFSPAEIWS